MATSLSGCRVIPVKVKAQNKFDTLSDDDSVVDKFVPLFLRSIAFDFNYSPGLLPVGLPANLW